MGTWDTGSFDNDEALDWVYELEEADDLDILADAFEAVLEEEGNIPDESDCVIAICAAEVVAGLMSNSDGDLPEEVQAWIRTQPGPPVELVAAAQSSLKVILTDSGLKELWAEADIYAEWERGVLDLLARVQGS